MAGARSLKRASTDLVSLTRFLLAGSLTERQHCVVRELLASGESVTLTDFALFCSSASEPTARRTISYLRELGLVACGSANDKGKFIRLTVLGELVLRGDGVE
ncbi:MAG: hypothetical protein V1834_04125 [Candidatus Micrarchaeota archaeon]